MNFPIPDAALAQHQAVLGKTGAGKTVTVKGIVENRIEVENARVCIFDPVKSDYWGLTSSADGKSAGLPFSILGGPHGHLPIHPSAGAAIGELVARGELPLSIIDMADFPAGGLQTFFIAFAEALLKHMRGVLYLVIDEAHEFAPKERAGLGNESMSIHYAKKLATAGRSKGIRLIVATQRVQALHNAVLGSCDTLIAQRITAPADQEPVIKWLKANASKDVVDQVSASLSSLPTGTGWIVSGEAKVFERVTFPMIRTFDNSKTPTKDSIAPAEVATAAIDLDRLRTLLAAVAPTASPGAGKAGGTGAVAQASAPSADALAAAERRGYDEGLKVGRDLGYRQASHTAIIRVVDGLVGAAMLRGDGEHLDHALEAMRAWSPSGDAELRTGPQVNLTFTGSNSMNIDDMADQLSKSVADGGIKAAVVAVPTPRTAPKNRFDADNIGAAAEKLLTALCRYPAGLSWPDVCIVAGMSHGNGYFYGGRKSLVEFGLAIESDGRAVATAAGRARLASIAPPAKLDELLATWSPKLKAPGAAMLQHVASHGTFTPADLAAATGIKPGNGFWYGGIAAMRDVGLVIAGKASISLAPLLMAARDGRTP